jgi:Ca2+-binding RTX toxin-like protein
MSHPNDDTHLTYSATRPSDQVLSPDGTRLYTSGPDGIVRVYDTATGAPLASWNVGTSLGAIDIHPTGSFLMVTERQPLAQTGDQWDRKTTITVYKVDTETGAATSFPYVASGYDYVFFDVAVMGTGKVLLSQEFSGSGPVPLKVLDPGTGGYTVGPQVRQSSILSKTPDGSRILVAEANTSGGDLNIYMSQVGIVAEGAAIGYNWGIQAISPDAGLTAIYSYGNAIQLYDSSLNYVRSLGNWESGSVLGLAFDPKSEFLYVLDTSTDAVVQIRVSDGSVVMSTPLGHDAGSWAGYVGSSYGSNLIVDPIARTFIAMTPQGTVAVANPAVIVLEGTPGPDRLEGGPGNDELSGRGGDDVLIGDGGDDTLYGDSGNDRLYGGAGRDSLNGDRGDDLLDGGDGIDSMGGFTGNDVYIVDHVEEEIFEGPYVGIDEIRTALAAYSLAALPNVENLTGTSATGQTLIGNGAANVLFGGMGDDILEGRAGNDTLIGFGGADVLRGHAGDDVYIIDAADTIVELAGDGIDEVRTQAESYILGDALENLRANSDIGHDFRGNAASNVIVGGEGNDIIRAQDGGGDLVFGKGGVDSFYFGAAFESGDLVDGGDNRDALILQGNYPDLSFVWNITGGSSIVAVESISLISGSVATYGDTANNLYSYDLTLSDFNVAAGALMKINGSGLLAGENFALDASAETDASLQVFGGLGTDTFIGGSQNDNFIFGHAGQFGAGDTIDGGAGYDVVYLRGDYVAIFSQPEWSADTFRSIESIGLLSATDTAYGSGGDGEFDYSFLWFDHLLAAGKTITVNASSLTGTETVFFNGGGELDGHFRLFGGKFHDTLIGGGGNDLLQGGRGADIMNGLGGADTFRFLDVADSTASAQDIVRDFASGVDKVDLARIDANPFVDSDQAFRSIGTAAFSGQGAASAGELRIVAGPNEGDWIVEADSNGDGTADLVIGFAVTPALTAADFLL